MSKINTSKIDVLSTYGLFGQSYRIAALSKFYLTVSGIIIPILKSIRQL